MNEPSFVAALDSWHDFYIAAASASAALLGLLFVGVSINLAAITGDERLDLRTRADLAFSNLLYLLGISLITLIPAVEPGTLAISFAVIAVLGLFRIARRIRALVRGNSGPWARRDTARRLAWTVAADVLLMWVAAELAITADPRWMLATTLVAFMLLLGAADVAWGLMLREPSGPGPTTPGLTEEKSIDAPQKQAASAKSA